MKLLIGFIILIAAASCIQEPGLIDASQASASGSASGCKPLISKFTDCGKQEFKHFKGEICNGTFSDGESIGLEVGEYCGKKTGLNKAIKNMSPSAKRRCGKRLVIASGKLMSSLGEMCLD